MKKENIIIIGKIAKADGVKGLIRPDIDLGYEKTLAKAPFVFIFIDGLPIPFKIMEVNVHRDYAFKLEDIDSPEKVQRFINLPLGIHEKDMLLKRKFAESGIKKWEGYTISNQCETIGRIVEVASFPGQLMAVVENNAGKTYHIPFVDEWIVTVDLDTKIIDMNLPDGILEVQ